MTISPPNVGRITLTCNIADSSGLGDLGQPWRLRGSRSAAINWSLARSGVNTTVTFVACDPRAEVTAPPANGAMLEQEPFELVAAPAAGVAGAPTVVGTLPADLAPGYRFSHTGAIAMNLRSCGSMTCPRQATRQVANN